MLKTILLRILFFVFIFKCSTEIIYGQKFFPLVNNYTKDVYYGGNQNWGIDIDTHDFIYLANNDALLVFDGFRWEKNELPNRTIIRSVKVIRDTVYIGTYEDFGYFTLDNKGFLKYTSLTQKIPEHSLKNLEFWQIDVLENNIYFRSFSRIFCLSDNRLEELKIPNEIFISSYVLGNKYILGTLNHGLYEINPQTNETKILEGPSIFDNAAISAITDIEGNLLVGTDKGQLFIKKGQSFQIWNSPLNHEIEKYKINKLTNSGNGKIAVGTILNGVYVLDTIGNILYNINKMNGLQNNTVLSQIFDRQGNLWMGLDNGIDMVEFDSPIEYFTDQTGFLGSVYAVYNEDNRTLLGSNKGVYSLKNDELKLIEGSQGHVWDIFSIKNKLLISHNNKLYNLNGDKLYSVNSIGGWYPSKVPDEDYYFRGLYTGLGKISMNHDQISETFVNGFRNPIKYLAFETSNILWGTHPYKGIYKLTLNETHDSVIEVKNYNTKGILSPYKAQVIELNNRIIFPSGKGWQIYDPLNDTIVMYENLNNILKEFKVSKIIYKDTKGLWLNAENQLIYMDRESQKIVKIPESYYKRRLIQNDVKIIKLEKKKWMISLDDGFAEIDLKKILEANSGQNSPEIMVKNIKSGGSFLEISTLPIQLNSGKNNISIQTAISGRPENYSIIYKLNNYEKEWKLANDGIINYNNLPFGDYILDIKSINSNNLLSNNTKSINLIVLPPWYFNKTALIAYFFIILIMLYSLVVINKWIVKKNQNKLRQKHIQEQRKIMREKRLALEKKLTEIRAEEIKKELIMKEKELANTAMVILRNKEILREMKKEIEMKKDKFSDPYTYKRLLNKLEKNIADEETHEIFETNFNAVHEDFQKSLLKTHPKLTHKDLKLCALLKMNLSNKEIAPMLNITPRSVELQRYRLRRKLQLEKGDELVKYLIKF